MIKKKSKRHKILFTLNGNLIQRKTNKENEVDVTQI